MECELLWTVSRDKDVWGVLKDSFEVHFIDYITTSKDLYHHLLALNARSGALPASGPGTAGMHWG